MDANFWTDLTRELWLLPDAVLKGTALLLLVFAATRFMRHTSAAARHLVWALGLAGVVALPLLSATIPWRLPLPAFERPAAGALTESAAAPDLNPAALPATKSLPFAAVAEPPSERAAAAPAVAPPALEGNPVEATTTPGATAGWSLAEWARLVLAVWLVGLGLLLARLLTGVLAVQVVLRRASPVPAWHGALAAAAASVGLRRLPRLARSDRMPMPITAGLWRPVVILPAASQGWSDQQLNAVLLHELAHIARGDLLTNLLSRVACALYWFHPMVWAAARQLRADSERACDDLVLTAGTVPSDYASHLLQIVRLAGRGRAPALALPLAQRGDFEGRLLRILEPDVRRTGPSRLFRSLLTGGLALWVVPLAALGPAVTAEPASLSAQQMPTPTPTPQAYRGAREAVLAQANGTGEHREAHVAEVGAEVADLAADVAITSLGHLATKLELNGSAQLSLTLGQDVKLQLQASGAVQALVKALMDANVEVRATAAQSLGEVGDSAAVAALMQTLRSDTDAEVRRMAAWALGEIEDARAVPALADALRQDKNVEVRRTAAWALGQIENPAAVDALGSAMGDSDVEVRRKAIWALGQIEDARAVPALGAALKDGDAEVRKQAAWALGQIESVQAVPFLTPLVRDPDAKVRKMVVWALGQIEDRSAVPALSEALKDSDRDVRKTAVWALGQVEDPAAAPGLALALKDGDAEIRAQAAWAIGQLDDLKAAPPELIAALRDGDAKVRKAAAHAAGEIEDPAAVPGLTALVRDADANVRKTALWALSEMRAPAAYEALVAALKDDDPEVRKMAARALGNR